MTITCIDNYGYIDLEVGKEYEVLKTIDDEVEIDIDATFRNFPKELFKRE